MPFVTLNVTHQEKRKKGLLVYCRSTGIYTIILVEKGYKSMVKTVTETDAGQCTVLAV